MNYLDRNEFNYAPSQEVVEALKNFDINKLCFYTRIYDEGKKSILSVYLSETYGIDEPQVLLGYGGEDILKQAVHYFLTERVHQICGAMCRCICHVPHCGSVWLQAFGD